ncbi:hypothetical protein OE88DRAFT_252987 [Heliocybe sulcata]|uniref:Uncharacterized protein n=1 Tax=Heliocybe sulcata TaxID=5364 RepID=A0A5C3MYY4_9AGAM|nr:hypothetical protein OE88DRAFT_252987 [Heliocybe sulcata]
MFGLTVTCLRQQGGFQEDLRADEWGVDIPTIGSVYPDAANIIRYYNGLGVALERRGWTGRHHWLRRGWTIQETFLPYYLKKSRERVSVPCERGRSDVIRSSPKHAEHFESYAHAVPYIDSVLLRIKEVQS